MVFSKGNRTGANQLGVLLMIVDRIKGDDCLEVPNCRSRPGSAYIRPSWALAIPESDPYKTCVSSSSF